MTEAGLYHVRHSAPRIRTALLAGVATLVQGAGE